MIVLGLIFFSSTGICIIIGYGFSLEKIVFDKSRVDSLGFTEKEQKSRFIWRYFNTASMTLLGAMCISSINVMLYKHPKAIANSVGWTRTAVAFCCSILAALFVVLWYISFPGGYLTKKLKNYDETIELVPAEQSW